MSTPLKISVWEYTEANPGRKELIVENDTHWIASFNWDEGQDNPYTPTEKEARDNAQMLVAAQAMKEALIGLTTYAELVKSDITEQDTGWYYQFQAAIQDAGKALTLSNSEKTEDPTYLINQVRHLHD